MLKPSRASNPELSRIRWQCRRGMLELDYLLIRFFEQRYLQLPTDQQALFVALLDCQDVELYHWLIQRQPPQDLRLAPIIQLISERDQPYVQN